MSAEAEGLKILLVDDEVEFITALAERLNLRGFRETAVFSGVEALRIVEADPPGLVVLDLMMPGLGGTEVLKRIRALVPQMPVILLTGHGSEKEANKGMQLGAFDYLVKPLHIDELIAKMREAVAAKDIQES
jgi:DNA-binding response OmpR family regulator